MKATESDIRCRIAHIYDRNGYTAAKKCDIRYDYITSHGTPFQLEEFYKALGGKL